MGLQVQYFSAKSIKNFAFDDGTTPFTKVFENHAVRKFQFQFINLFAFVNK